MKKIYSLLLIGLLIVGTSTGYATDKDPAPSDNTEILINSAESVTVDNVINTIFTAPSATMGVKVLFTNNLTTISIVLINREVNELDTSIILYPGIWTINKHTSTATATNYTATNRTNKTDYVYMC